MQLEKYFEQSLKYENYLVCCTAEYQYYKKACEQEH